MRSTHALVRLHTTALAFAVAVAAGALHAGCSPANVMGTSADGGPDEAAAKTACSAYAYAYCTKLTTCSRTLTTTKYGSTPACESLIGQLCEYRLLAPGTGSTTATTAACKSALDSWMCSDFMLNVNPPPECAVTMGKRSSGSPCAVSQQCTSGYCGGLVHSLCGTCMAPPQVADPCTENLCPQGLTCRGNPPACAQFAGAGQACSSSIPCGEGLTCVAATCQYGVADTTTPCAPSPGAGCDANAGLTCDASTDRCVLLPIAGPGQACGNTVGTVSVACTAGTCPRGACVPYVHVGAACDIAGPGCISPSRCIVTGDGGTKGTCQLAGAAACN